MTLAVIVIIWSMLGIIPLVSLLDKYIESKRPVRLWRAVVVGSLFSPLIAVPVFVTIALFKFYQDNIEPLQRIGDKVWESFIVKTEEEEGRK